MATEQEVYRLGRQLLDAHGLRAWHFGFDSAKQRVGQTMHSSRSITVSRYYVRLNTLDRIRITILHEIAHALVGHGHGHDKVWQAKARSLGIEGTRVTNNSEAATVSPPATWVGQCVNCGHKYYRNRLTQKLRASTCGEKHGGTGRLVWRRNVR